jgi:hypothetical protein
MRKKIMGLASVIAAVLAPAAVQAMPVGPHASDVLKVQAYSDLLEPIPNALALLNSVDASAQGADPAVVEKVQYHHHHHHHHVVPRVVRHLLPHRHYHHHHHHHY